MSITVYHGTDIKSANAILRDGVLRGDWPLFGPGICLTVRRARGFVVIKCGRNCRRRGRVIELEIDESLLEHMTPECVDEAFTLDVSDSGMPLRELRLDDPRVLSCRVISMTEQMRIMRKEVNTNA